MMDLKYHKLFIHDHLNSRVFSECYTSDATNKGRLFIIFESPKNKIDQQPLIDKFIDEATADFYSLQNNQDDPELILEDLLQKMNQLLPELSGSIKGKNWLENIDLIVGIIFQDKVYISSVGNMNGLLLHNNQFTTIISKNTEIDPIKIFSDIVSGQLDENDVLIISTNSLFDYISNEKIKQIVKRYSVQSAVMKIKQLLETIPDFVTLNAIFIKKSSGYETELNIEESREEIKPTQDTIEIGEKRAMSHGKSRTKLVVDVKALNKVGLVKKFSGIPGATKLFFSLVKKIILFIFNKIKNSLLFISSSQYRKNRETKTLNKIRGTVSQKYNWFSNLDFKKRIALIGTLIIFLVFMQTLVFLTQQRGEEKKNIDYQNALEQINEKFSEIEAVLIYNDEESAENLLLEINQIIDNLNVTSAEQEEEIKDLSEKVWQQLNKVRHIHEVPSPAEIMDMTNLVQNTENIVQKEGNFYLLADNQIFLIKDDDLTSLKTFPDTQTVNYMTDWPGNNKVVMSATNTNNELSYFVFNLNNKETVASFQPTANNTHVTDLRIYGNNLYVLDRDNNQIFKYPEKNNGFGAGSTWLQPEVTLGSASSLAIDGSIYTIDNDGKIRNFLKGQEEKFAYHEPRPIIGSGATIKTFKDSDYLYIIDPQNMRVIILDKDGNIKDQYTSLKFDDLKDLAIDPEEKAIYLLNGAHLYLLAIND